MYSAIINWYIDNILFCMSFEIVNSYHTGKNKMTRLQN